MKRTGAIWLALLAAAPGSAIAQSGDVPRVISPLRVETDHNNVNLVSGKTTMEPPSLSVPGAPNLSFDRAQNAAPYVLGRVKQSEPGESREESYSVHVGGSASESFRCIDYDCLSVTGSGSTFIPNSRIYRQAGSGIRWQFNLQHFHTPLTPGLDQQLQYYAQAANHPNGEVISYSYDTATGGAFGYTFYRPNKIASSMGYEIRLTYQGSDFAADPGAWASVATATLYLTAPETALRRLTYGGNTITDSGDTVADISDDRTYNCTGCGNQLGLDLEVTAGAIQLPGETTPAVQVSGHPIQPLVTGVNRDGVQWSYAYLNPRQQVETQSWLFDRVTVTGPNGFNQVYDIAQAGPVSQQRNVISAATDSIQRRTEFQFDEAYRPTRIIRGQPRVQHQRAEPI